MFSLRSKSSHSGFTLIELLVVIAILATLIGLGAVGISKTMKGADETRRNAFAKTVESALMAYKNETGSYPLAADNDADKNGQIHYGSVSNNNADKPNAKVLLTLFGRNESGRREATKRAYITDSSDLYVYKGKRIRKLDEAFQSGGVSADDMIGFKIMMGKTTSTKYKKMSGSHAFSPIKISFDLELDSYSVSVPSDGQFNQVIQLN
ncbi:MAG: type II secretion system protein [Kiritimatiellia bacterium]